VLGFYFRAEDGIRDFHVTGVQTCALPIFASIFGAAQAKVTKNTIMSSEGASFSKLNFEPTSLSVLVRKKKNIILIIIIDNHHDRSEERRVGKEGKCEWWRYH